MLSITSVVLPSLYGSTSERMPSIEDDLVNHLIRHKQLIKLNIPSLKDFHLNLVPVEMPEDKASQSKISKNLSSLLRESEDSWLNRSSRAKNSFVSSPNAEKLCKELNFSKIKESSDKTKDDDLFPISCKSIKINVNKFKKIQYDQCKRLKMIKRLMKIVSGISEDRRKSGLRALKKANKDMQRMSTKDNERTLADTLKFEYNPDLARTMKRNR